MAKKKGNWIAGAIKEPGSLHADLGVPSNEKIGKAKIAKAAQGTGVTAKRARLAETLAGFKHGGKKGK